LYPALPQDHVNEFPRGAVAPLATATKLHIPRIAERASAGAAANPAIWSAGMSFTSSPMKQISSIHIHRDQLNPH
jgi:hypothetical protein